MCGSVEELERIAAEVVQAIGQPAVVLLNGTMGAGKTTFTRAVVECLGATEEASSPTFSIVNEYPLANGDVVYHFDLYRLESPAEVEDIGIEEYVYSGNWCFIEWPERAMDFIPEDCYRIDIEVVGGERMIQLSSPT